MLSRLFALLLLTAATTATWALSPPPPQERAFIPPPFRLMESPGAEQAIQLQSLRISSELSGSMAETTVRMVFFNPNGRWLEGNLQFPLLPGQQITAFSLDIDGKQRPAVSVEKAKGREIFEAIQRRKVDPGLLEVTQGNNFKLRVYPIPARGTRTVEIKYAEALVRNSGTWAYRLPLAYGDHVQNFDLSIRVNGEYAQPISQGSINGLSFQREGAARVARVTLNNYTPSGSLTVLVPASAQTQSYVQQRDGENYFLAEIPVTTKRKARALPKTVSLLWDSSGSGGARDHNAELAVLDRYFKALGNAEVHLTRLRDRAEPTERYQVNDGNWDALRKSLENTTYDGASALADWTPQAGTEEYLLVSDGLSNYGPGKFPTVSAKQRLYALVSSLSSDTSRLTALTERTGGQVIQIPANKPGAAALELLTEGTTVRDIRAQGATDVVIEAGGARAGILRVTGRLTGAEAQLTISTVQNGKQRNIDVAVNANSPAHTMAAYLWANYKLQTLEADHEFNRGAIRRLGTQFAIPTRETSLIVLERIDDYARYDVKPPPEYLAEYENMRAWARNELATKREKHLEQILSAFDQKIAWWENRLPKKEPARHTYLKSGGLFEPTVRRSRSLDDSRDMRAAEAVAMPAAAPAPFDMLASKMSSAEPSKPDNARVGIALQKWTPNASYISRMKAAEADTLYRVYLDEKPSYTNSSAFFLDAADMLLDKGQRDLALRVLSNLAEMDLENRHVLRILGYRLMQAGAPELAVPVFEKVKHLAEEEPQSFRDLGLAYAAAGKPQQAVDHLYEVVVRPWDWRFAEVELIALADMNAIIAASKGQVDTSRIDQHLLRNLPLDLRVVLTWDSDNSDIDLWITEPGGEQCYYGNRFTAQGGRMSPDFTGGYGPEEFSLRRAKPGKYKIEANFAGHSQQIVSGATTLQVKLTSGFGTEQAKDKMITLRLKGQGSTVYVGEFEVKK